MRGSDKTGGAKKRPPDQAAIESPCTGVCELDQNGLCRGCLRSLEEIAAWAGYDDQQKLTVLGHIRVRRRVAD